MAEGSGGGTATWTVGVGWCFYQSTDVRAPTVCQVAFRKFNTQHDTHPLTNIHKGENRDYEPIKKVRYLLCARCWGNTNELHLALAKEFHKLAGDGQAPTHPKEGQG